MCVAPLVDDAEVRQFLQNAAAGGVALVERRFRDGISAGEIPSDFPVAARASQVTGSCAWADHACADGHAAQDAPQRRRGSGRLGAPAAAWKCGAGILKLHGGWSARNLHSRRAIRPLAKTQRFQGENRGVLR